VQNELEGQSWHKQDKLTMIVLLFFTGLNAPGFCSSEKPEQLWSICSKSQKSVGKKISASPWSKTTRFVGSFTTPSCGQSSYGQSTQVP
jgi:hypothetical protein